MRRRRTPPSQTWRTFLENHTRDLVSLDFFTVPTIRFQILYVFLVLAHHRRRIVHFAVTAHPTAEWTAHQLLHAFPWDSAPRYLLRDRDGIFGSPRLYVLDRGKALHTAVRRHAGESAFIQRCQVYKKRNVVDHLPEEHKTDVRRKLQNAYSMADYQDAKRALERLHHELMHLNSSAARSLEEGLEETVTVHKLWVPDQLRRTLSCTNVIESAFSSRNCLSQREALERRRSN